MSFNYLSIDLFIIILHNVEKCNTFVAHNNIIICMANKGSYVDYYYILIPSQQNNSSLKN